MAVTATMSTTRTTTSGVQAMMHNPPHPGEAVRELCIEPLGLKSASASPSSCSNTPCSAALPIDAANNAAAAQLNLIQEQIQDLIKKSGTLHRQMGINARAKFEIERDMKAVEMPVAKD